MSDSVWPHRWQPTRPHRPWDSPDKNTGVGCHFLLQCMKLKVKVKSRSRVWLFATPWTAAYHAPPSMGFSRQEYWSGVPAIAFSDIVIGHVHDHFCLKRRKGWCIFSNSVKKTVGCLSLGWTSAAFFHYEVQGNHIFWNQKVAISGTRAPPESLSSLFLLSWGEDGAGHAYPSRTCAAAPLPSSFRGGGEGPSLCQRQWRARQGGGSRDRAWQHRKCWHKLIKRGIWEDWISCWFMAALPRLPGRFFTLVHCCSWFMLESQCIGWLGILVGWMEGRALLPCQPAPIQSSSHPSEYSPIHQLHYLPHKLNVCIFRLCYIPVQASLMAQC